MFEAVVYIYDRDTVERPGQRFSYSIYYPDVSSAEVLTIATDELATEGFDDIPDEDDLYLRLTMSSGTQATFAYNRSHLAILSPRL